MKTRTRTNKLISALLVMVVMFGMFFGLPLAGYALTAPSQLGASADSSCIYLTWKDNSNDETGFIIERKEDGVGWGQLDYVLANVTTYNDTNVKPGKIYYYKINAFKTGSASSSYSNEVSIGLLPPPVIASFTVTFKYNNGQPDSKMTVTAGDYVLDPLEPYKEGFTLAGWYNNPNCTGAAFDFSTPIYDNFTLYAKWEAVSAASASSASYKVTFKYNNGQTDTYQSVLAGYQAFNGMDPTREGFVFRGWYIQPDCTGAAYNFNTPVNSDLTLYAKWEEKTGASGPDDGVIAEEPGGTGEPGDGSSIEGQGVAGIGAGAGLLWILLIALIAVAAGIVVAFIVIKKKYAKKASEQPEKSDNASEISTNGVG